MLDEFTICTHVNLPLLPGGGETFCVNVIVGNSIIWFPQFMDSTKLPGWLALIVWPLLLFAFGPSTLKVAVTGVCEAPAIVYV